MLKCNLYLHLISLAHSLTRTDRKYVRYSDHNVPLTATDMDLLLGKSVATPPAGRLFCKFTDRMCAGYSLVVVDGSHAAIVACFSLSSGCYATMCLRELLHTPTHFSSQKQLSLEAKKQKGE